VIRRKVHGVAIRLNSEGGMLIILPGRRLTAVQAAEVRAEVVDLEQAQADIRRQQLTVAG
jgi:hypothetical protein